jgi:hypothetical protein
MPSQGTAIWRSIASPVAEDFMSTAKPNPSLSVARDVLSDVDIKSRTGWPKKILNEPNDFFGNQWIQLVVMPMMKAFLVYGNHVTRGKTMP